MAMLLVLATLVISVTAATIAVYATTSAKLSRSSDRRLRLCEDLAGASAPPIRDWLARRSSNIVLPPHVHEPKTLVLHDRWIAGDEVCELRVTAWDQCGMTPIAAVVADHGLARSLPRQTRARLRTLPRGWLERAGLDQLDTSVGAVFPTPGVTNPRLFGATGSVAGRGESMERRHGTAAGAILATHNPPMPVRARRGPPPVWLNINTAPAPLLEQALRLAGVGGLDRVLAARGDGTPAALSLLASVGDADTSAPIRFVGSSPAWGVRIDVLVGAVRRSWWEVWVNTSGQWEVLQRLAIDE